MHWNVTAHPTAEWTAQQFRMVVSGESSHRFLVHDHDSVYSEAVDRTLRAMGLTVLTTPVRSPQANAFCERLIGTIRRECLDFVIPLSDRHVRSVLSEWVPYYNRGRPHASLGPGIPEQLTPASVPVPVAIESARATVSPPHRCSAACIMTIVSSRRHELDLERSQFLRITGASRPSPARLSARAAPLRLPGMQP